MCGRVCYKSEDRITADSAKRFVKSIIDRGHESVLEHFSFSVRFITDRSVTHELVRHRLASYSQESQRYVNYGGEKNGCTFIIPVWSCLPEGNIADKTYNNRLFDNSCGDWYWVSELSNNSYTFKPNRNEEIWLTSVLNVEKTYNKLLEQGNTAQNARSVLPNSTKTEIIMTTNLREWRHILKLRTSKAAHPQIRSLMTGLLKELQKKIPVIFDDIVTKEE